MNRNDSCRSVALGQPSLAIDSCAAVAWLLTLTLRRNRASVRYWIWLAVSAKFLIPFSLLVAAGSQTWMAARYRDRRPQVSFLMEKISQAEAREGRNPDLDSLPSLFAALEQQLGFRLESRKGPVETYVIDHVERPSGN